MKLDIGAAQKAVASLAARLGITVEEAAAGIHRVVNENMAAAARMHAVERGRDIRRFALVATGGAGPVHAWGVARALGVRTLIFPPSAGVASAFGMLTAPPAFDFARSLPAALGEVAWANVRELLRAMEREGRRRLAAAGVPKEEVRLELAADVRHRGQGETTTVELGEKLARRPAGQLEHAFEEAYGRLYGRRPPGVEAEVITWRLRVRGPEPGVRLSAASGGTGGVKGTRPIWSEEKKGLVEAIVVDRYRLGRGESVRGPAVVEERESTVVIGLGGRAVVDGEGSLRVELDV
jgi:N-methylhydantoinase A/oxoprolinase/acetone carboxylase beta subunit